MTTHCSQFPDCSIDNDGFLPVQNCVRCSKPLHGKDSSYPAELYAGTYNGLCYSCTNSGPLLLGRWEDGCELYEHPPHCPSWRRDRERFIGFTGCTECAGKGRIMVYRSDASGGSYPKQCSVCSARHNAPYLEFLRRQDEYRKLKEELEAIIKRYSGRRAPEFTDEEWRNSADAVRFREGMKLLWSLPTPQPPKLQEFTPYTVAR